MSRKLGAGCPLLFNATAGLVARRSRDVRNVNRVPIAGWALAMRTRKEPMYGIGAALVFTGSTREAFPTLEHAIRLSPRDPYMGSFLVRMANAHLVHMLVAHVVR